MKTEPLPPGEANQAQREIPGRRPTDQERFWLEQQYRNPVRAWGRIEETAKLMLGVVTALSGLATAAWKLTQGGAAQQLWWWLPFALWTGSILCFVAVLFPGVYGTAKGVPKEIEATYRRIVWCKYGWLALGTIAFLLGLIAAFVPMALASTE